MAKRTSNQSSHVYKILTFDDDVGKNDKHCKLSIINEKGDSKYYKRNKSYKDNEQKTTTVKRTDAENKNVVKREQKQRESYDDSSSYSCSVCDRENKDYGKSYHTKHRRYLSSDSSKSEDTGSNYRGSCLSCTSTVSSAYDASVRKSSNNRKLKATNKQFSENVRRIDSLSPDHRRHKTNFKAYEDSEISTIYSSISRCTTENEKGNSHNHHDNRNTPPALHNQPPKISTITGSMPTSTFHNPQRSGKPRPKSISLQTQTQEPKQNEYDQSKRNKIAEKQTSKPAVGMSQSGNDQQNSLKPYTNRHDKEAYSKNSPYCNIHEPMNVVVAEPILDYTKTALNIRNAMEKDKTKRSADFSDLKGLARNQKHVEIDALPRKNYQRQSWLLKIFCRKRRKRIRRRRRNIHISFKRRRRRRRRLRKRSRKHITPSVLDSNTKHRNQKLEVNTSKNKNERTKLVDFKDSKTDQSIDSSSLIEGLKNVLSKVWKYQSLDEKRNLKYDREVKSSFKDGNNKRSNHETARTKMYEEISFQQSEDNLKCDHGGKTEVNEKRSPKIRCPMPMSNVIVNTVNQRIPKHEIPYTQNEDSCCKFAIKDIKISDCRQKLEQPNPNEKQVSANDIDCVESGKVNIEYGDTFTLHDQIKTDIYKASSSNLLRSLCKHFLSCIIGVLWSPCLLVGGLCWFITYPVRPRKPVSQSRNNIFCRAFKIWLKRNMHLCCLRLNILRRRNLNAQQKRKNCKNDVRRISTAKQRIPYKIKKDYLIYPCTVCNTRNSKTNYINKHGLKLVTFPSKPEYSRCNMKPLIKREVASKLSTRESRKADSSEEKRRNKRFDVKQTIHKEISGSNLSNTEQKSKGDMKKDPKVSVGCLCSNSTKLDTFANNTVHTDPTNKDKKVTFSWQKVKSDIPSCSKDHSDYNKIPTNLGSHDKLREDLVSCHSEQKFACACKAPIDYCDCNKVFKEPDLGEKVPKDRASRDMAQNITFSTGKVHATDLGPSRDKVPKDVRFREKVSDDPSFRDMSKIVIHQRENLPKDNGLRDMLQKNICSYEKAPNPRDKLLEDGLRDKISKNSSPRHKVPKNCDYHDKGQQSVNSWPENLPKNTDLRDKLPKNMALHAHQTKVPNIHCKVPKDRSSRDKTKIVIYLHDSVPKHKVHKERGLGDTVQNGIRLNENIHKDPGSHDKTLKDRNSSNKVSKTRDLRNKVQNGINCSYDESFKALGPRDKALEDSGLSERVTKDRGPFHKETKDFQRDVEQKIINLHEKVLNDPDLRYNITRGRDLCDIEQRKSVSKDKVPEHLSSHNKIHEDPKFKCSCGKEPKDHCSCDKVYQDRNSRDIVLEIIRSSRDVLPTKDNKLSFSCGKTPKDHCECDKLPQKPVTADRVPKNHVSRYKKLTDNKITCSCGKMPENFCECGNVSKNPDSCVEVQKYRSSCDVRSKFTFSEDNVPKDHGSRKEEPNDPQVMTQKLIRACDKVPKDHCECNKVPEDLVSRDKVPKDRYSRDMEQKSIICACDKVPKAHCECNDVSRHRVPKDRYSRDIEQNSICACDNKVPNDHCECDKVPEDLVSPDRVPKDRYSREIGRKVTFSGEKAPEDHCPRHNVQKDRDSRDMQQKLTYSKSADPKHNCLHDKNKTGLSNVQEKKPIKSFKRRTCNKSKYKSDKCNEMKRTKSISDLRKRKTKSVTNFVACRFRKWREELNPLIDCNLASYQDCQKHLGKPQPRPFVRSSPNFRETLRHCLNIITCCLAGLFCLPWIFCCQIFCKILCCCE